MQAHCAVLCCAVLCCAVLCCAVPCCALLVGIPAVLRCGVLVVCVHGMDLLTIIERFRSTPADGVRALCDEPPPSAIMLSGVHVGAACHAACTAGDTLLLPG